jgi:hypothetical protein
MYAVPKSDKMRLSYSTVRNSLLHGMAWHGMNNDEPWSNRDQGQTTYILLVRYSLALVCSQGRCMVALLHRESIRKR